MERSNTYIFVYSIVMVVVVAAILTVASFSLKETQQANIKKEKMQNILMSIRIDSSPENVEILFKKYVTESFLVDKNGKELPYVLEKNGKAIDTVRAFDIDLKVLYSTKPSERVLPIFKANKDGISYVIMPLRGKGLWGPVWGYVSVGKDYNTVYGAVFDHQGETPGLGAEINKDKFEQMFQGKQLFDSSGKFTSISVIKGGALPGDLHGVDAISGGTITSNGVSAMLDTCLRGYSEYLELQKK